MSSSPFAEGIAAGELRYEHCRACGTAQTLDPLFCRHCGSGDLEWLRSAGAGVVTAASLIHRAPSIEFRDLAPYLLVMVRLDEGAHLMAHGTPGLAIGDRAAARFFTHGGQALVRFHPSENPA